MCNYCVSGNYSSSCSYLKHNVSETALYLHLHVEPTQLAQPTELAPTPEHQHQHKPSVGGGEGKKNSTHIRPSTYVHALFHGLTSLSSGL